MVLKVLTGSKGSIWGGEREFQEMGWGIMEVEGASRNSGDDDALPTMITACFSYGHKLQLSYNVKNVVFLVF